jgi:anti-anti-sigma factor
MDAFPSGHDESQQLITVRGDVDLATSGDLLLRLLMLVGTATGQIALDLSQVTFINSAGLSTLVALDEHVRTAGGSVRLAAVSPAVARLFELVDSRPLGAAAAQSRGIRTRSCRTGFEDATTGHREAAVISLPE